MSDNLKTLLKRLDVVRGKIFNIAETNYQDMLNDGGFRPKTETKSQKKRGKKSKRLRAEENKLESKIANIKKLRGSGGGGMLDLTRRAGKSLLQLANKRSN